MTISRAVVTARAGVGLRSRRWRVAGRFLKRPGWNAGGTSTVSRKWGGRTAPARARNPMRAGSEERLGKVSHVASFSSRAIGLPATRFRAGDGAVLHRSVRRDPLGVAMTARMRLAVESARRWAAAEIFRLASLILRGAMKLHQQRRISHSGLRTVLSATRWLEHLGGFLALGPRQKRQQTARDLDRERID
jgi:hypothetical protein